MSLQNPPKEASLLEYARLGLKKWPILMLGAVLGGMLGVVATVFVPPKYKATALIQINTQPRRPERNLGELADLIPGDATAETESELIKSRSVVGAVADSLGLQYQAAPSGFLRKLLRRSGRMDLKRLRLPVDTQTSATRWTALVLDSNHVLLRDFLKRTVLTAKIGEWTQKPYGTDTVGIRFDSLFAEPGQVFAIRNVARTRLVNDLLSRLSVAERGRKTGVLELSITASRPDLARNILNAIAVTYVRQNVEAQSSVTRKSLDYFKQQLPAVRQHLDSLEDILKFYRSEKGAVDFGSEAQAALKKQNDLQQQKLTLEQHRQDLLRLYREDHPSVTAVDAQIHDIETEILGSDRVVKNLPLTQQATGKIARDIDVNMALYSAILNNIQQLQVVQGGEAGSARIVDPADSPLAPVSAGRGSIVLLFIVLGTALAFGSLLLAQSLKAGVDDSAELEVGTGVPVLCQLPMSPAERKWFRRSKGRKHTLAQADPSDVTMEAMRSLRTGIEFAIPSRPRIVAVSSLSVGDGKSFVTTNLAVLFAQTGRRVVLLDADLRRGRISHAMGVKNGPGLTEYLEGKAEFQDILCPTEVPYLSVIPTGAYPNNPAEVLGRPALNQLLAECAENSELVLIDTPPVMLVSDPLHAMRASTHSLMVVASSVHAMPEIQDGLRRLRMAGIENVSLVLNKCDWNNKGFGYYARYGKLETTER